MFCFIENMTNGSVNNNINAHMNNSPYVVGVITPPDNHYKPVLYSDAHATAQFNNLNRDIYQGVKSSKNINEKKTPLSIKILAGIGLICAGIYGILKLFKK